jgi:hypothetical protein
MADIKPGVAVEKTLPLNEKPLAESEKLRQSLERVDGGEKLHNLEQPGKIVSEEISQKENAAPAVAVNQAAGIMAPTAKQQKQVESILAKDLAEIYLNLAPDKREEFKKTGEETASKINQLLNKTKINVSEIIKLIKKWLSLIPGVNKYFLEKEAKIKAEEIIKMKSGNLKM